MSSRGVLVAVVVGLLALASGLAACASFDTDPAAVTDGEAGVDGGMDAGDIGSGDASLDGDGGGEGGAPAGMVAIHPEGLGTFFIDAHEVTFGEYAAFVDAIAANTVTPAKPPRCAAKSTFAPPAACTNPMSASLTHPVACVDWCDAFAYCQSRGKRLCGKIGGGPYDGTFPATEQWGAACSGPMGFTYPYGNMADDSACWTKQDGGSSLPSQVATAPRCEGGVPGLFDMSGNVWEWEDYCGPQQGGPDLCVYRGGSVADPASLAGCSAQQNRSFDFVSFNIGFRCCSDP